MIEVVLCKDCEFLTPSVWEREKGHCCRLGIMRPFDWYCADGRSTEPEIEVDEINLYDEEELHHNCTVQILRNSITGEVSVGWWENGEGETDD